MRRVNEDLRTQKDSERKGNLEEFIKECQLQISETGKTFVNPSGVEISTIDYFLYSKSMAPKVTTLKRLDDIATNVSDHLPLSCTVQVGISRAAEKPPALN